MASFFDSLTNFVANLGTSRDKASHTHYSAPDVPHEELLNAYRGSWLARKIVDIPALDACRAWRNWQAESDQISKIEALESRLQVKSKVLEALKMARLMGGSAIYIGSGEQNISQPIRETATIRHLTVLTSQQLSAGDIDNNPESEYFGKPAFYRINSTDRRIHPSRLAIFQGAQNPGMTSGWADSILTPMLDTLKQAEGTSANIASLVYEAKIDVVSIPGFAQAMKDDPKYGEGFLRRLTLAATAKSINGMLLLDADESYEQKSASFASLKDILLSYYQLASGAADIPMTRLIGQSPGGLQATGDADTRNYYDMVRAEQDLKIRPALAILDDLLIHNALGSRPQEIWYDWSSLWQPSAKEQSEIGNNTANMVKTLSETRLFPDDVLSEAATNVLTERGVMPGLESAMAAEEYSDD